MELSHIGENGYAKMVAVDEKSVTVRQAVAGGKIRMQAETLARIKEGGLKKGDVLAVAEVAGIMAAKKTSEIIPMCHNIVLDGCEIAFSYESETMLSVLATVTATAKTGVEMEALTAVTAALGTVYDMVKAIDRGMVMTDICLLEKSGGRSGHYKRGEV